MDNAKLAVVIANKYEQITHFKVIHKHCIGCLFLKGLGVQVFNSFPTSIEGRSLSAVLNVGQ